MSQISVKYFIQPEKKPSPFATQSEKFWFCVNPKIFFPFFFFNIASTAFLQIGPVIHAALVKISIASPLLRTLAWLLNS